MEELDRSAAVAVKTLARADFRALVSSATKMAEKVDKLVAAQDEEILRLRRLIVSCSAAYRRLQRPDGKRPTMPAQRSFAIAIERITLEADAIMFSEDLKPKTRPVARRG